MTLIRAHRFIALLMIGTMLLAIAALMIPGAADDTVMNVLSGILAAAGIPLCLERLSLQPSRQAGAIWATIAILLGIVAFHEFTEYATPETQLDDIGTLVLLGGSLAIAFLLSRFDPAPRLAVTVFRLAFATQCLATTLDISDRVLVTQFSIDSGSLEVLIDFTQFVAIQGYFGAALVFLLSLNAARLSNGRSLASLGDLARFIFVNGGYFYRVRYPHFHGSELLPFARQALFVVRFLQWVPQLALPVWRLTGRSPFAQAVDIVALYSGHGLDAQTYYLFELYRPEQRARAAGYLTRFETKNGLIYSLNKLFPKRRSGRRSPLGNKADFARFCAEAGIRGVPSLARIRKGRIAWSDQAQPALQHDFFVKLEDGKGARGAGLYEYLPGRGHRTPSGAVETTEAVLRALAQRSMKEEGLLLQPRLVNHPDFSDLAEQSLIAIRVITCMDIVGNVTVAYAMLRVLGVLEPRWRTRVEFAAPINLTTGTLGRFTGDKGEMATRWSDRHLVQRHVRVAGRVVPHFDAILAAATQAHQACGDRFIVGWDIACTPDGPVILEGNSYPDIEYPQRVHQAPVSESALGPILYRHLMMLDRSTALLDLIRKL
jgi:hypothetical protein